MYVYIYIHIYIYISCLFKEVVQLDEPLLIYHTEDFFIYTEDFFFLACSKRSLSSLSPSWSAPCAMLAKSSTDRALMLLMIVRAVDSCTPVKNKKKIVLYHNNKKR